MEGNISRCDLECHVGEIRAAAYTVIAIGENGLWSGDEFQACVQLAIDRLAETLNQQIFKNVLFVSEVRSELQRLEALRQPASAMNSLIERSIDETCR